MPLKVSEDRVLQDALAYPAGEPFEQSLGRSVRRHGGDYQEYIDLIGRVREAARLHKLPLREAARWILNQP